MTTLQSDTIGELMPALIAAQGNFAPAVKKALNPAFRSKYVDLEGVIDAVLPALLAQGVTLVQQTTVTDTDMVLVTRLIHTSGEWLGCDYRIRPVKQDPQGEGSALTYARRYSAMAICGIAPEDDDGNAASQRPPARKQTPPPADPPEDKTDYGTLILTADTPDALKETGAAIAAANIPEDKRARLKTQYTARMTQLREAS